MEKSTPPIGEPNATATPAALAAVTISLILPTLADQIEPPSIENIALTLISPEAVEKSSDQ